MKEINVLMGEAEFAFEDENLISLGLGSCIGVAIYQPGKRLAALGHVMLPDSRDNLIADNSGNILLGISDNKYLSLITETLASHKYNILTNEVKRESLINRYIELKPNLVLLDNGISPGGDIVLCELLKKDSNANIIIHCNRFEREIWYNLMLTGAKEALFVPYSRTSIEAIVNVTLKKHLLKYADIMIPYMIEKLCMMGLSRQLLVAKMAGGAQMFASLDIDTLKIGQRNAEALRRILKDNGVRLVSEDIGGSIGRSLSFDVNSAIMGVRTKEKRIEL